MSTKLPVSNRSKESINPTSAGFIFHRKNSPERERGFTFPTKAVPEQSEGFTILEILVVVGIIVILTGIALGAYNNFSKQVDLDVTTQGILSTLRDARSRTLASEGETVYGVHFETDKYTLFAGSVYDASASANKVQDLTSTEIYSISLTGGGSEVLFDRIRGTTDQYGSLGLRLVDNPSRTQTITIDSGGQVSTQNTVNPTDTRVTDTRHLHFDLGWSIQGGSTLTLTFADPPNPNVVQNVSMATYFNVGQSVFDWEDTIDVNGSDQILRVHTHNLDAFDTLLSIHRDRNFNDKAVTISIDGLTIVSYAADGTATVGASGGTMSVQ